MALAKISIGNSAWSVTESIVRQKPTKADLRETRTMLQDFYIQVDCIPAFETLYQLLSWRKTLVKNSLM